MHRILVRSLRSTCMQRLILVGLNEEDCCHFCHGGNLAQSKFCRYIFRGLRFKKRLDELKMSEERMDLGIPT